MMAKSWDASRLKARFPARKKGAGKAREDRVGGFPLYGPVSGSRLPRSGENGPIWLGRVLEEHPADGGKEG